MGGEQRVSEQPPIVRTQIRREELPRAFFKLEAWGDTEGGGKEKGRKKNREERPSSPSQRESNRPGTHFPTQRGVGWREGRFIALR